MRSSRLLLAACLLPAVASAQCPFATIASSSYGLGCNPVFGSPPTVSVSFDATNCTVQVTVGAFSGCCNTFLTGTVLGLGVQAAAVPVPQIGPGCTLLVLPDILLLQATASGNTFVLTLPATALPPLTFFAQGGALYFTTIGFTTDLALTDGAQVSLN